MAGKGLVDSGIVDKKAIGDAKFWALWRYYNNGGSEISLKNEYAVAERLGQEINRVIGHKMMGLADAIGSSISVEDIEGASLGEKVGAMEKLVKSARLVNGESTNNVAVNIFDGIKVIEGDDLE